MFTYLETLKVKPGHIRERIAFGTAAGVTAVVAVGWVAVVASSGTFALSPIDPAVQQEVGSAFADTRSNFDSLLGAVGAAQSGQDSASGIVVETQSSTTADAAQPTVIPF